MCQKYIQATQVYRDSTRYLYTMNLWTQVKALNSLNFFISKEKSKFLIRLSMHINIYIWIWIYVVYKFCSYIRFQLNFIAWTVKFMQYLYYPRRYFVNEALLWKKIINLKESIWKEALYSVG